MNKFLLLVDSSCADDKEEIYEYLNDSFLESTFGTYKKYKKEYMRHLDIYKKEKNKENYEKLKQAEDEYKECRFLCKDRITILMRDRKVDNKIRSYLISKFFIVVQFQADWIDFSTEAGKKRDENIMNVKPGKVLFFTKENEEIDKSLENILYLCYTHKIPFYINGIESDYPVKEKTQFKEFPEKPNLLPIKGSKEHHDQIDKIVRKIKRDYYNDIKNKPTIKVIKEEKENIFLKSKKVPTKSQKKKKINTENSLKDNLKSENFL